MIFKFKTFSNFLLPIAFNRYENKKNREKKSRKIV